MDLSPPKPKGDDDDDDVSLLYSGEDSDETRDSINLELQSKLQRKVEQPGTNNGFLRAPLTGPVRPLSPDSLSNLSIDDYDQLRSAQPPRQIVQQPSWASSSSSNAPLKGWRGCMQQFWIRNKGILYMLLGQFFGTMMNVSARVLEIEGNKGRGFHPFQVLFVRMSITSVLASGYMWYKQTPHFPLGMKEVRGLLVARGFGGFFGVFGMYYSLLYLPLADATVITFLAPALACWACAMLIKEPFTRTQQIGALVSLIGVVLIARPTALFSNPSGSHADASPLANSTASAIGREITETAGSEARSSHEASPMQRLGAVGFALLGVLGSASAYTTIRWIGKRAHPLISVNYFAVWCTIVSIVMILALPDIGFALPADLKDWGLLIFLGLCGFIMQFLLAAGLAYEKSSRATNMIYSQMLFALGFDKLIFGHTPGLTSIIGSSLILGSAMVVAIQKDPGRGKDKNADAEDPANDEESQRELMSGASDPEIGEDHDRIPLQDVQLRTFR